VLGVEGGVHGVEGGAERGREGRRQRGYGDRGMEIEVWRFGYGDWGMETGVWRELGFRSYRVRN